jgi:hypothetical protein
MARLRKLRAPRESLPSTHICDFLTKESMSSSPCRGNTIINNQQPKLAAEPTSYIVTPLVTFFSLHRRILNSELGSYLCFHEYASILVQVEEGTKEMVWSMVQYPKLRPAVVSHLQ